MRFTKCFAETSLTHWVWNTITTATPYVTATTGYTHGLLYERRKTPELTEKLHVEWFLQNDFCRHTNYCGFIHGTIIVPCFIRCFLSLYKKTKWTTKVFVDMSLNRSVHGKCSVKKGVLKSFANFTGKHLCRSLFLIKLQAWRPKPLLKRNSNTGVFLWI